MSGLIRDADSRGVMVAARVSPAERVGIWQAAQLSDRTPSREIRRAIRFYLAHTEAADAFLRGQGSDGAPL